MASDNGKKYILSDVEDFAKKNSFNDTFKMAKTWEEIGFHVSALSYKGFRVITLSRWGSGVLQLFFSGDTFLKTRYSLGTIHYTGITQWTKDYIDNPYGIQRIWFNIKNGYQEGDKHHYKEFLKNKNKVHIDENMKKQTIKLKESQLRNIIKESIKKVLGENFQKPENWKDTPFKGTYQDEDGSIYMPDDDYEVIDEDYTEYGHDLNDIMLSIESDRGIYDKIMMLVKALSRKEARGVIIDFNTLVKSSVINQLTNDSIKMVNNDRVNRGDEPYRITPSDKQQIKIFLSNKVLELVEENK